MYLLTQDYRTQLEISNIEKLTNQKLFVIQRILTFDSHLSSLPYSFYPTVVYPIVPYSSIPYSSGIEWGHYQWISKLLTQIALCENVYDNRTEIVKTKF